MGCRKPAISKCSTNLIDSTVLGCLLCPQLRASKKPTYSCFGLCMSAKRGSLLLSSPFLEVADLSLVKKYYLTVSKHACSFYRCSLIPPTTRGSWEGSASLRLSVFLLRVANFLMTCVSEFVIMVSWSSDFILKTFRLSAYSFFFGSCKCFWWPTSGLPWISQF